MAETLRLPRYDEEWGAKFVQEVEDYMGWLYASLDSDAEIETISGYPFCGCEECDIRERYFLATKLVLEGHEQGKVWLEDVIVA